MRTSLAASTVTPGMTAPDVSLTTPVIDDDWADAARGRRRNAGTSAVFRKPRMSSPPEIATDLQRNVQSAKFKVQSGKFKVQSGDVQSQVKYDKKRGKSTNPSCSCPLFDLVCAAVLASNFRALNF